MENITIKIGKGNNFQREIFKSTLFYETLQIKIEKESKVIYTTHIYPNRFSFSKNELQVKERIKIIKERLKLSNFEINNKKITFFEKALYYIIFLLKRFIIKFFLPSQWVIGYKKNDEINWKYLKIDGNEMWADPFVVYENNKYYIFYEEMSYSINKGHISVGELDLENGKLVNRGIVLEEKYHLSYPFIFKENKKWYMIPESSKNKTIDLYEAINFPYKWKFRKNLLSNIEASDSTLLKKDNKWYLFTSESSLGISPNDELSIFVSNDFLKEDFKKNSENPIISDVKKARMAGSFFIKNSILYRPSQDCSKRYGYKVNINKVDCFDENNYQESIIETLKHPKNIRCFAMHTYNFCNNIEVADFKILRFDIPTLIKNMRISLKKILKLKYGEN